MTNLVPLEFVPKGSLPASLVPLISFVTSSILGSDGQFDGVTITDCKIGREASEADIQAAMHAVQQQCQPCGADFALRQLALLRVRTKARADADSTLTAAAYADWLAEYPPDVAQEACEEWARGMIFWPAWSELQRACDRLCSSRIALRRALQKALEPAPGVLYLGKPKPETRAERLRASMKSYLRHNRLDDASRVELELAQVENRAAAEWSKPTNTSSPDTEALRADIRSIMARAATPDQLRQAHLKVLASRTAGKAPAPQGSAERVSASEHPPIESTGARG